MAEILIHLESVLPVKFDITYNPAGIATIEKLEVLRGALDTEIQRITDEVNGVFFDVHFAGTEFEFPNEKAANNFARKATRKTAELYDNEKLGYCKDFEVRAKVYRCVPGAMGTETQLRKTVSAYYDSENETVLVKEE